MVYYRRPGSSTPTLCKVSRPFPAMIERQRYYDAWAVDITIRVTLVIYTGRFAQPVPQWQPIARYVPPLCINVRDHYLVRSVHMFMDVLVFAGDSSIMSELVNIFYAEVISWWNVFMVFCTCRSSNRLVSNIVLLNLLIDLSLYPIKNYKKRPCY